jgi:ATP-binding cassette, subfamily G (WHITE), member 2, SNQ2
MSTHDLPTDLWAKEYESARTEFTYEDVREQVRTSNPNGLSRIESGVDVERAERDFEELSRHFSNASQQAKRLSGQGSAHDIEKVESSPGPNDEPWDLENALHGSKEADDEAGIKPKHIGGL